MIGWLVDGSFILSTVDSVVATKEIECGSIGAMAMGFVAACQASMFRVATEPVAPAVVETH